MIKYRGMKTYFIHTFGCQANKSDSERIAGKLEGKGYRKVSDIKDADYVVINTCMIRQSAENRVYGLVHNLGKTKGKKKDLKIVVTGCMVGMAVRDKSGKLLKKFRERMPSADEFLPIEEVGFDIPPVRTDEISALVPISNGCNNFCTYCVVPFTRGREVSRPFEDIISEVSELSKKGYKKITLIGQNVNSYGADLVEKQKGKGEFVLPGGRKVKPINVLHLGRLRIPTLFPYLLETVAKMKGLETVDFMSSNPWDFSDELIDVIVKNPNITRHIHLPVQSGDDNVLKRMNRWYSAKEYLELIKKIKKKVKGVTFGTDIIVGFPGETEREFKNTVSLCKKIGFKVAYVSEYSARPVTTAPKVFGDNIAHDIKKKRWQILEDLINKPNLSSRKN